MLKYFLLVGFCVLIYFQSCNCNNNTQQNPDVPPTTQDDAIPTPDLIPIPTATNITIRQTYVTIDATDDWLAKLGIDMITNSTCIVNSANKALEGGGGINDALMKWVITSTIISFIVNPWNKNQMSVIRNDSSTVFHNPLFSPLNIVTPLNPGDFAILQVEGSLLILAVGIQASEVTTLVEITKIIENLYYNILALTETETECENIVLCAISTGNSAGAGIESKTGKSFTKEQFIRYVYNGIHTGINKFTKTYPNSRLEIILNNWHPS